MTWTVERGDVHNWSFTRIGNTVVASFLIIGTSVGGTPDNELRIALPPSITPARNALSLIRIRENVSSTALLGYANIIANRLYVGIHRFDEPVPFSATTNGTDIYSQIAFEVL